MLKAMKNQVEKNTIRLPKPLVSAIEAKESDRIARDWLAFFGVYLVVVKNHTFDDSNEARLSSEVLKAVFNKNYKYCEDTFKEMGLLDFEAKGKGTHYRSNPDIKIQCTKYTLNIEQKDWISYTLTSANVIKRFNRWLKGEFSEHFKRKDAKIQDELASKANDLATFADNDLIRDVLDQIKFDHSLLHQELQWSINNREIKVQDALTIEEYFEERAWPFFALSDKNNYTLRDNSGRLYTPWCVLTKAFRRCAYFEKVGDLVELDFSSFQPWILSKLDENHFCTLFGIQELPIPQSAKWLEFKTLAEDGTLYQTIADRLNTTKAVIKETFWGILFDKSIAQRKYTHLLEEEILTMYPELKLLLDWLKQDDYKQSSFLGRKIESQLIIQRILVPLLHQNYRVLSIHDAIYCHQNDKEYIENYIRNVFNNLGIQIPNLKSNEVKPKTIENEKIKDEIDTVAANFGW